MPPPHARACTTVRAWRVHPEARTCACWAHLIVLPRTLIESSDIGFFPLGTSLTALRCVFIAMSTPAHTQRTAQAVRRSVALTVYAAAIPRPLSHP
jgi:hypothetical protein